MSMCIKTDSLIRL